MPVLRIEFLRLTVPKGDDAGLPCAIRQVTGDAELPIGGKATPETDWPTVPALATHAMLYAIGAPCYVAWSFITNDKRTPDPTTPGRKFVPAGEHVMVAAKPGMAFACIAAPVA